jgi:hypothetical protein
MLSTYLRLSEPAPFRKQLIYKPKGVLAECYGISSDCTGADLKIIVGSKRSVMIVCVKGISIG